jgi:hypothetical protein
MSESYPTYCRFVIHTHRYLHCVLELQHYSHQEVTCAAHQAGKPRRGTMRRRCNVEVQNEEQGKQRIGGRNRGSGVRDLGNRHTQGDIHKPHHLMDRHLQKAHHFISRKKEIRSELGGVAFCRASLSNFAMRGYQSNARPQERAMTQDK